MNNADIKEMLMRTQDLSLSLRFFFFFSIWLFGSYRIMHSHVDVIREVGIFIGNH